MTVKELIERLESFDPTLEVFIYDNGHSAEAIIIEDVRHGETDGVLWVDTQCDGIYYGTEANAVQIVIQEASP